MEISAVEFVVNVTKQGGVNQTVVHEVIVVFSPTVVNGHAFYFISKFVAKSEFSGEPIQLALLCLPTATLLPHAFKATALARLSRCVKHQPSLDGLGRGLVARPVFLGWEEVANGRHVVTQGTHALVQLGQVSPSTSVCNQHVGVAFLEVFKEAHEHLVLIGIGTQLIPFVAVNPLSLGDGITNGLLTPSEHHIVVSVCISHRHDRDGTVARCLPLQVVVPLAWVKLRQLVGIVGEKDLVKVIQVSLMRPLANEVFDFPQLIGVVHLNLPQLTTVKPGGYFVLEDACVYIAKAVEYPRGRTLFEPTEGVHIAPVLVGDVAFLQHPVSPTGTLVDGERFVGVIGDEVNNHQTSLSFTIISKVFCCSKMVSVSSPM